MQTTTVPVTITPEAEALVDELGYRSDLERIVDHARQTIPGLDAIEVTREDLVDEPGYPRVVITAWKPGSWSPADRTRDEFGSWYIREIPGEAAAHLTFDVWFRDDYAR